jgi:hypothetical protein
MRRTLPGCVIVVAAAVGAGAPAAPPASPGSARPPTQPATRPRPTTSATQPVTQPADLSTPKAALRALAGALRSGDGRELSHVVSCRSDAEQRAVAAMAEMSAALVSLRNAAVSAYGEQGAGRFTADPDAGYKESLTRIDAAEVAVSADGQSASVHYPGSEQPEYVLVRSADGHWRVPATQFSKGAEPAVLDRRVAEAQTQVVIMRELAREIAAGKYKNAETAGEAWRSKVMQALGPRAPGGTTKPAPQ